jgi:large subunit ribosomal protein L37Ae
MTCISKNNMAKDVPTSVRRFGSRYGRRVRLRFGQIEESQRKEYICPYCGYEQVKRVSAGIWNCKKCGSKFTGKAYSV